MNPHGNHRSIRRSPWWGPLLVLSLSALSCGPEIELEEDGDWGQSVPLTMPSKPTGSEQGGASGDPLRPDRPAPDGSLPAVSSTSLLGWVGTTCAGGVGCGFAEARCLLETEGFPGGMCSRPCQDSCPDPAGEGSTAAECVDGTDFSPLDGGVCLQACDQSLYPGTGCRAGYECIERKHLKDQQRMVSVCLPEGAVEDEPPPPPPEPPRVNCLDDSKPYADGNYSCFDWRSKRAEAWRPILELYFKAADMNWAIKVMNCESGGNPDAKNKSSGASGLFQHMPQYWAGRAKAAGFEGASIFDPEANIAASAYLYYHGGPGHWSCKAFYFLFFDPWW